MIKSVRLQNFRSFTDRTFEFEDGLNVVSAPNASGKTNLLEAIYLSSQYDTFRGNIPDVLAVGADWARVDAAFDNQNVVTRLKHTPLKIEKSFEIGARKYIRPGHKMKLPVVLFEVNDLLMLKLGPSLRRKWLDLMLAIVDDDYPKQLRDYQKILAQRNALLKAGAPKSAFFVWDIRLADLASTIITKRSTFLTNLTNNLSEKYSDIANKDTKIKIEYIPKVLDQSKNDDFSPSKLLADMTSRFELDSMRKATSIGPHRDDIVFGVELGSAQKLMSRGEQRSLVLALKEIELEMISQKYNKPPLLLLDDVYGELDKNRRNKLAKIWHKSQSFVTTTDADILGLINAEINLIEM